MEKILYNTFKSKNAANLAKPITESSYKVLLDKILFVTIKPPVPLLRVVEFLTSFNR